MTPTPEQDACLAKFQMGENLRIIAYAGAGKTATLRMLASNPGFKTGVYICFNKATADAAAKTFPIDCRTMHSLAYRRMIAKYTRNPQKMTGNLKVYSFVQALRPHLKAVEFALDGEGDSTRELDTRALALLVFRTLKKWMVSDRPLDNISPFLGDAVLNTSTQGRAALEAAVCDATRVAWKIMTDPTDSTMMLGFDGYLKEWALSKPRLPYDYIMLDEAQDTNGVVIGVLREQKAQLVMVGDPYQQLYEWRGAIDAMQHLPCAQEARLTQTFRFGTELAEKATTVLKWLGEDVPLQSRATIKSNLIGLDEITPNVVIAYRNRTLFNLAIELLGAGQRPHIVGGAKDLIYGLRAIKSLQRNTPVDYPEEFIGYQSWGQVIAMAQTDLGEDLVPWVNLVSGQNVDHLIRVADTLDTISEDGADIVLSTVHKAKGKEWTHVELTDDFILDDVVTPSDLRLFYVALTRGIKTVAVSARIQQRLAQAA